jgi:hypothetical protein
MTRTIKVWCKNSKIGLYRRFVDLDRVESIAIDMGNAERSVCRFFMQSGDSFRTFNVDVDEILGFMGERHPKNKPFFRDFTRG